MRAARVYSLDVPGPWAVVAVLEQLAGAAERARCDRTGVRPYGVRVISGRRSRHALLALRGRSDVAFLEIHGEPVYLHALRALVESRPGPVLVSVDAEHVARVERDVRRLRLGAVVLPEGQWWDVVRRAPEGGLVVHDGLCPLTPTSFLAAIAARAEREPLTSLVAFRPVTDTLKVVVDDRIEGTLDRETVVAVTSPAFVPAAVLTAAADGAAPPVDDFARLVAYLRARGRLELVRGPSLGRRVDDKRAVHLLESIDEVGRRVRTEPGHRGESASKD